MIVRTDFAALADLAAHRQAGWERQSEYVAARSPLHRRMRFSVRQSFLSRYAVQNAGGAQHQEYWIPAEELPLLNENIVGPIEVIAEFHREGTP